MSSKSQHQSMQWTIPKTGKHLETLEKSQTTVPISGSNESESESENLPAGTVLIKLHAASLNYRDLLIARGQYPFPVNFPIVPGSDGAGEIVRLGPGCSRGFKKGDRVVTLFNQKHIYGAVDEAGTNSGLGGALDGIFREYAVFSEEGLVKAPKNLDWGEAATLTCAGVTAWNALFGGGGQHLRAGQTVLVQGTGGVSLFALQFAKAAGATVIATTSSKEKEEMLKKLGADFVLNYTEDKDWGTSAKKMTSGGTGVDFVIEVGGKGTLEQSLKAIKYEGVISIIGFLGGADAQPTLIACLSHICTARGVYVGSRALLEDMVAAIEANDIHPVIDEKRFKLEELDKAYQHMWDKKHIGKIVIDIA
ncbi:NAD(P)-binding protein [Xylariaceae sp. FL0255]|nr:NAD(P)-binding protein [Xylariaceae sp. FL0255]